MEEGTDLSGLQLNNFRTHSHALSEFFLTLHTFMKTLKSQILYIISLCSFSVIFKRRKLRDKKIIWQKNQGRFW